MTILEVPALLRSHAPTRTPPPNVADELRAAGAATPAGSRAPGTVRPPVLPPAQEFARNLSTVHRTDVLALFGSVVAALSSTVLLFGFLAPFSGRVGFVAVAFVLFLGFYALLVSTDEQGPAVRDRVVAALVHGMALLLLLALASVVAYTFKRGADVLGRLNFYLEDFGATGPLEPVSVGGIKHAVVGTLWMISIALVITVPLGVACAVFLNEIRGPFARFVRTITEAMTALPSIIAGLFIYATWILTLGQGKSGLAAALALSVMMLPIIIRAADVVLRLVPGNLMEAGLALGAGPWRVVWHVTLPTARSGLATAVILGTARGIGETSPVLLTAGSGAYINYNPVNGLMTSLPLATFEFVKTLQPAYVARGFGAAATLLVLVLLLFAAARIIGGRAPGDLTRRQQSRAAKRSADDVRRFAARPDGPSLVNPPGAQPAPVGPDGPIESRSRFRSFASRG